MRPRSPKRWLRPRSRRWYEAHGPQAPNVIAEILKECYPQARIAEGGEEVEMRRPEWARIARKFGWITSGHYWSLKPVPVRTGRKSLRRLMYAESPFFRMLKKREWPRFGARRTS